MRIKEKSEKTCWAEYKDGFALELRYVTRAQLKKMRNSATKREWDPRIHQPIEAVDEDKFYAAIAKDVVIGWRGLTGEALRSLVDMDEYPDSDVPYSLEFCADLLRNAYDLELWVMNVATELAAFDASRRALDEKNS